VRWLASGPRAGLGEITHSGERAGLVDHAGQGQPDPVRGADDGRCPGAGQRRGDQPGGASGNFELNVFKPLIAHNVLQSLRLLADGCASFDAHCARGIEPQHARIDDLLTRSLMLVTALAPHIGYDPAAAIAKHAHLTGLSLREAALASGLVSAEQFDQWVRPQDMLAARG
jgi:fumarate hydratase, class II